MKKIEVSNQRICAFYENNPGIQFEAVNLIFIDLFDKLLKDMNTTMNATINSEILCSVNQNTQKMNEMNNSITFLKEAVHSMNTEITNNMLIKFTDIKQNYMNDLRTILKQNTNEDIGSLLEKNNNQLINKTTLIINDVIPKSQTNCYSQLQESIRSFHKSISDDTRVLLKYIDNNSIKEYINNFEMKSSMMFQNMQQPIFAFITASEDRINHNINNSNITQNKIVGELNHFLNNFRELNYTDFKSNDQLNVILNKLYMTSEVIPIHKNGGSPGSSVNGGDTSHKTTNYMVRRSNKPKIFIQNADMDRNINNDEINEFLKNIEENNCHGIFLSQKSGFMNKANFHIETHNKLILVYVHNCNYVPEKIKSAMDIIDSLSVKLKEFNNDNGYEFSIEKEILEEINKEYQNFIVQKEAIINVLKDSQKKIFSQIDEFKFPILDKYLSTKFSAPVHKQGFKCDLCKNFNANNLKALAAHKRGCVRKNGVHPVVANVNVLQ